MTQVSKAVLERAKKIMLEKNGEIPIEIKQPVNTPNPQVNPGLKVNPEENINTDFVPLKPAESGKPAPFKIPAIQQGGIEYDVNKDRSTPKKTAIKTEPGETENINDINIWNDKATGKCGISIGDAIYQIAPPIFELFTRMVSTQRSLTSDLETERFNNKKLKENMV